jgi:REP element-mobilizing transposase RayT
VPQSLAKILVHTVFSTKERRPFLRDKNLREELHHYIGGILKQLDCQSIIVGGVEDFLHRFFTNRDCAQLHRRTGRTSSEGFISGRIAGAVETLRDRIR